MELSKSADAAIRKHVEGYLASFNDHKREAGHEAVAKVVASAFVEKPAPMFIGAAGVSVGQKAIAERFAKQASTRFKDAKISLRINSLTPVGTDVVMVGTSCLAAGIRRLNGDPVPDLKSNSLLTVVKDGSGWKIATHTVVNETADLKA